MTRQFLMCLLTTILGALFGATAIAQDASETQLQILKTALHESGEAYLVDGDGRSLYLFLNDEQEASECDEACAENWPPARPSDGVEAGEGVDSELISTIDRTDGTTQLTYHGWPLYYFVQDGEPGDTSGQAVGDVWFLVSPAGEPMPSAVDASTQSTSDSSSASETPVAGGVPFTEAQVQQGMAAYEENCAACHQSNLRGSFEAPELAGPNFRNYWGDKSLFELYNFVSATMPLGRAGSLSDQTYADIISYILSQNDYSSTGEALEPDPKALRDITIPGSN